MDYQSKYDRKIFDATFAKTTKEEKLKALTSIQNSVNKQIKKLQSKTPNAEMQFDASRLARSLVGLVTLVTTFCTYENIIDISPEIDNIIFGASTATTGAMLISLMTDKYRNNKNADEIEKNISNLQRVASDLNKLISNISQNEPTL